jgi:hypothetical protein
MLEDNVLQNNILRLRRGTQVDVLQRAVLQGADQGLVSPHVHFGQACRRDIAVDHQHPRGGVANIGFELVQRGDTDHLARPATGDFCRKGETGQAGELAFWIRHEIPLFHKKRLDGASPRIQVNPLTCTQCLAWRVMPRLADQRLNTVFIYSIGH